MNGQRIVVVVFVVISLIVGGYFAFRLYQVNQQDSDRNQIISTLYEIGNDAQRYFDKPIIQGGGGSSYTNWVIPEKYRRTAEGTFSFVAKRHQVNLSGIGTLTGRNGITNVRAIAKVDSTGIQVLVIN